MKKINFPILGMMLAVSSITLAAVSPEEAKQLGGSVLTPFGSERAGNKEGTIPAYSGQMLKAPAGYDPKNKPGYMPDPFNEKPLFTITAQNYEKYADKLDGFVEMFKRFPHYRMDVYPSHRNWVLPQNVLENSIKNATSCKAVSNELKLEGCYAGVPFPIPKTGGEAMWNHLFQFEANVLEGMVDNYIVPPNGDPVLNAIVLNTQGYPLFKMKGVLPSKSTFWQVHNDDLAPARKVGGKMSLLDNLDLVGEGRRAWQYIPGQRRVKLAPDLAYDTPSPYSGGSATMDDQKVFLGAFDRYDLKLRGKKEKFLWYNAFKFTDKAACPTETMQTKNFPNPDCIRWELHRVWVIDATLKPGFRHVYHKRTFYWDEDAPGTGISENYDAANRLYRISFTGNWPFFDMPGGVSSSSTINLDLTTGLWALGGGMTCKTCTGWYPRDSLPPNFFSPEALAGEGIR